MGMPTPHRKSASAPATPPIATAFTAARSDPGASRPPELPAPPREVGGRSGPEPTRFGDWEKNGRCIDF